MRDRAVPDRQTAGYVLNSTAAFSAAIITNIWLGFPFMMVIALGGLQGIPGEMYEAASIDGATNWQQFYKVGKAGQ